MINVKGYAARNAQSPLSPFNFQRRSLGPKDIQIKILYCGVCHSDLHIARNEWHNTIYPVVPGHEIVGKITAIGQEVSEFQLGEYAAVGCLVNSCRQCSSCQQGLEQYCEQGFTLTYNSLDKETANVTYGGYSDLIVVNEDFVLHVPSTLDIKSAAPLLCAGITTYSPLLYWGINDSHHVGVIGLGGLGHMAIKFAHALGAEVSMITTSINKQNDGKKLGADHVLLSTDEKMMKSSVNSLDFIINTIPRAHDLNPYLNLLKRDGNMVIVGAVEPLHTALDSRQLIMKRRNIAGSLIGGIKETQEMLNFCSKYHVFPEVEIISIKDINQAYERMLKGDVKYRFVIDMATL